MADVFLAFGTLLKWLGMAALPFLFLPFLVLVFPRRFARLAALIKTLTARISDTALTASMILAAVMVLVQLLVIVGRYVFDWSASWANELITYSFAGLFLLAAASALKSDAHVRVDILREKMSPTRRAAVDLIGLYLFLFPICILILWAAISPSFVRSWAQFEGSRESDGLPIYFLFRTLVPAFAVLLMTQGLGEALRAALKVRGIEMPDALQNDTPNETEAF